MGYEEHLPGECGSTPKTENTKSKQILSLPSSLGVYFDIFLPRTLPFLVHGINLAPMVNLDCLVNKTVICRNTAASVAEVTNCLVNKEERGCSQN